MSVNGWYPIGPSCVYNGQLTDGSGAAVSGRVTAIVIHPANVNTVYVGTATGGAWKTIDNGVNWTPLMDDQITLSVGAMTLDPENADRLYVATGEGNWAGETLTSRGLLIYDPSKNPKWELRSYDKLNGTMVRKIVIDKRTTGATKRILLATSIGLLESLDDGNSFTAIDILPSAPGAPGKNKDQLVITDFVFLPGATTAQDVLLVGIMGDTIYRREGTGSFDKPAVQICAEAKRSRIAVAVCDAHPERVYALFADSEDQVLGVYQSNDGGKTWNDSPTRPFWGKLTQGNYNQVLTAHPTDIDTVFLGEMRMWRTTNAGSTWEKISDSKGDSLGIHADQHVLVISPKDSQRVWAGNDGGAWVSFDGGASFFPRNRGLQTMQFYSLAQHADDANLVIAGAQDNGVPRYQGSAAWELSSGGDGFFVAIDPVDKFRWYSSYCFMSDGKVRAIQRSEKAGALSSWSYVCDNITNTFYDDAARTKLSKWVPFYVPFLIDPVDHTRLYLGTNRLYRSDHFGDDWQPVIDTGTKNPFETGWRRPNTITAICVTPNDNRAIWLGTFDGHVYFLDLKNGLEYDVTELTAGVPATEWATGFYVSDIAVTPSVDPNQRPPLNRVYISLGSSHVTYSATDNTAPLGRIFACEWDVLTHRYKFSRLDTQVPFRSFNGKLIGNAENPVNALVIDPDHSDHIFMGCDSGIFLSKNSGVAWEDFSDGLPNVSIGDLQFHKPTRLLRAATMGRSVWERAVDEPINPAAVNVDLYIRDNIIDVGLPPKPNANLDDPFNPGQKLTALSGADIKLDTPFLGIGSYQSVPSTQDYTANTNADYASFQTFSADNLRRKVKSRVYVEVMNRGPKDATEVAVRAFIVPKDINGYGLPPQNFWTNFVNGGANDFGLWVPVGPIKNLGTLRAASPGVAMWEFETPLNMPDTVGVLAIATCKEDPVGTPMVEVETTAKDNKRVALREVEVNMRTDIIIPVVAVLLGLAIVGGATAIGLKAAGKI
jgi:hypothetical protein